VIGKKGGNVTLIKIILSLIIVQKIIIFFARSKIYKHYFIIVNFSLCVPILDPILMMLSGEMDFN